MIRLMIHAAEGTMRFYREAGKTGMTANTGRNSGGLPALSVIWAGIICLR